MTLLDYIMQAILHILPLITMAAFVFGVLALTAHIAGRKGLSK